MDQPTPSPIIVEMPDRRRITVSGRVALVIADLAQHASTFNDFALKGQFVWNFKADSLAREAEVRLE
ncbi:MAG: hypothetical protein WCF84_02205 [Anaerolineae bacterium]